MRRILTLLVALIVPLSLTGDAPERPIPVEKVVELLDPDDHDLWFPVGEKLIYKLYWGIIPVGYAEFESKWHLDEETDRRMLVLQAKARTNTVVEKLFPINDFLESVVDPETFLPVRFEQRLREGRKRRNNVTTFDRDNGLALHKSILKNTEEEIEISEDTRDILSFCYFMRADTMDENDEAQFKVLVEEKLYSLLLNSRSKKTVSLPNHGEIDCLEVEPKAQFGGVFNRKGSVRLWFSQDDRHLCAKMTGKVPLAKVKAVLVKVVGPGDDTWVNPEPESEDEAGFED